MRFDFTIFGALEEMADISYVAGTLTNTPAYPTFKSAAFQIGSANYAPRFRDISFTQNATVRPVPAPNASSGVAGFATMDREPRLTFDPEMDRQANSGWWAMLRDGAPMNDCTFKVGVAGGSPGWNQIKMRFPSNGSSAQLQLTSQTRSSRDGLVTLPSTLLATLATGNDDFSYLLDNV